MKKLIDGILSAIPVVVLVALFTVLLVSIASGWERNNMSIKELTVESIKNEAGSAFVGVTSGDDRYLQLTGGNLTGPVHSSASAAFGNVSAATLTVGGHTYAVMTTTINGVQRHLLKY